MSLPAVAVSQSPESKFQEYLASRPDARRFSQQQRDLVRFIFSKHNHFDAEELIGETKTADLKVSRATIYRTLSELVNAGLLRRIELGSRTVYEHDYGYPQHEHLVCERCGKMIEFQSSTLEAALREVCGQHQFQMNGHTLVVRGTCADCNRARTAKRRLDLI